jgi:cytosine deaminase
MSTILRNARLATGVTIDVVIDDGRVTSLVDPGTAVAGPEDIVHDLEGMLLLPAAAEPHAHLDKAFTADLIDNPTGDLLGAIIAWTAHRPTLTVENIMARAEAAVRLSVANGITAIRTHVDLGSDIGLRGIEALCAVREKLQGLVDIEVVTLCAPTVSGLSGADQRSLLHDALDIGADTIGGAPYIEADPLPSIEYFVATAAERGKHIDLHTDETIDASILTLRDFARIVTGSGVEGRAAASHCVSLGMQAEAVQREVAEACAVAGVSIITLPQTNLFLQSREIRTSPPRGLTAIAALRDAGVNVAGGADNLQDPFNTVGRADPMETAALLVMAGHLPAETAYDLVTNASRVAMGLEPIGVHVGSVADFVAIAAKTVREAVATAPATRSVFKAGRLVASTRATTVFAGE